MPSSPPSAAAAHGVGSPAYTPAYTWLRLVEALDGLQKTRVEARHVEATALTALEHEAFGRYHDERSLRVKVRACLTMLIKVLAAADEVSTHATAAHKTHAMQEAAIAKRAAEGIAEARSSCEGTRRALQSEVFAMEAELQLQRAHLERQTDDALERARESYAHEAGALHGEIARLRTHAEAQLRTQDGLHEELARLRDENTALRQTAVKLRGEARSAQEELALERTEGDASVRGLKEANGELRELVRSLGAELEKAHFFINSCAREHKESLRARPGGVAVSPTSHGDDHGGDPARASRRRMPAS